MLCIIVFCDFLSLSFLFFCVCLKKGKKEEKFNLFEFTSLFFYLCLFFLLLKSVIYIYEGKNVLFMEPLLGKKSPKYKWRFF